MGLEKVKERVVEEARTKSKEMVDAATAEAKRIASAALKQAKEREEKFAETLTAEIEFIKKREAASAKLELKKLSLTLRKEFIEQLFLEVKEKLLKMPEQKRAEHVASLIKKAESEIEVGVIYCNKKDAKHVKGQKAKEADILGGVIAETEDGSLRVDYSYETMLEQLKDSLMPELNNLLFERK